MATRGRLSDDIATIASFTAPGEGVTRLAWSDELRDAYAWFTARCEEAGMSVEIDAAGNLLARWDVGEGPAVALGSHLDSVPNGGRFDGTLGVLAGLEAVRIMQDRGVAPARPVWLIAFMDEENARFNTAVFGSRAFCGDDVAGLGERRDADGITLREAMNAWGRSPEGASAANRIGEVGHYLELHIEQGPRLAEAGVPIGVVTSIVAMVGYRATVSGYANHAGTTPMSMRRDALAGASRMVLAVREFARTRPDHTTNVGVMTVAPGSSNVIPGSVSFTIDLRAPDDDSMSVLDADCISELRAIADDEGLDLSTERVYAMSAVPMDSALMEKIRGAAEAEGARTLALTSGAGHDAMIVGRHVAAGMLFVPSRDGVSHSPDEYTAPEQCELGARVLAGVVTDLTAPEA